MYLKLAEIYLFQEPNIPNYFLRFCLLSGLSGTSFTGYPLPDVAAGINLKNQVPPIIKVLLDVVEISFLEITFRVKFSRRTCLAKKAQQAETSANECHAVLRLTSLRLDTIVHPSVLVATLYKYYYFSLGEFRIIDGSV